MDISCPHDCNLCSHIYCTERASMSPLYRWIAIFSCMIGCLVVWSAIGISYFGDHSQKMGWPLGHWVSTLSDGEKTVLFFVTPFISVIIGGLIVGFFMAIIVNAAIDWLFK